MLAAVLGLGVEKSPGWRVSMMVPGVLMLIVAVLYWKFTQDCPQGNYKELRAARRRGRERQKGRLGGLQGRDGQLPRVDAVRDLRLRASGSSCSSHNVAASYYVDRFKLDLQSAGMAAGSFGLLALFARARGRHHFRPPRPQTMGSMRARSCFCADGR